METLAKPKGNKGNPLCYLRTDPGRYQNHCSQYLWTERPELENMCILLHGRSPPSTCQQRYLWDDNDPL